MIPQFAAGKAMPAARRLGGLAAWRLGALPQGPQWRRGSAGFCAVPGVRHLQWGFGQKSGMMRAIHWEPEPCSSGALERHPARLGTTRNANVEAAERPSRCCAAAEDRRVSLLSRTHPGGKSKARFLEQFGFSAPSWQRLAKALRDHAARHEVSRIEESPFGKRYIIDGAIEAPDGRAPSVRTVWFVGSPGDAPRFVTAHPLPRKRERNDRRA